MEIILGVFTGYTVLKAASYRYKHSQESVPLINMLTSLAGIDMLFRLIKFSLVYSAILLTNTTRFMFSPAHLVRIGHAYKLERVANFCGLIRVLSRYPRTYGLYKGLKKSYRDKMGAEQVLGFLGDLFNFIYFFFDHYLGLYLLGIATDPHRLAVVDFWGNLIWAASSLFYTFRSIVWLYKYENNSLKSRSLTYILFDLCRNILDTVINYHYAYPFYLDMESIAVMSIFAALLWMTEFWRL